MFSNVAAILILKRDLHHSSELLAAVLRYRLTHFVQKKRDRLFLILDSGVNADKRR